MLFKKLYGKEMLFLTIGLRIIKQAVGKTAACISKVLVQVRILLATNVDHSHCFQVLFHKHIIL